MIKVLRAQANQITMWKNIYSNSSSFLKNSQSDEDDVKELGKYCLDWSLVFVYDVEVKAGSELSFIL